MQFAMEHIGLAARDPVGLKNWYLQTLDARLILDTGQSPPAFFIELPGGCCIEIYKGDSATMETQNNRLAGWRHVALRVDSIEEARRELTSRGIEFSESVKPAGGGGQILFFQDVEGNLLHLVERPQDSPVRPKL